MSIKPKIFVPRIDVDTGNTNDTDDTDITDNTDDTDVDVSERRQNIDDEELKNNCPPLNPFFALTDGMTGKIMFRKRCLALVTPDHKNFDAMLNYETPNSGV